MIEIVIDRKNLSGSINLVGIIQGGMSASEAGLLLAERPAHADLQPHPDLPDDTRLWAALQDISGGVWGGAIYDVDRIIQALQAGTDE